MMMRPTATIGLLAATAARLLAQGPDTARGQDSTRLGPPVRQISTASAVSKEKIGSIVGVRELPDGRVLVNDGSSRRLLLLDTMLVLDRVVLDSASEKENTYGNRVGTLIPLRGDTTFFIDPQSLALLVLDPAGNIARVRSVPRVQDSYYYSSGGSEYGIPGTDAKGRLVYGIEAQPAPPAHAPPRGVPWFPQQPDSGFVVALDLETRKLDTIGVVRRPKSEFVVKLSPTGGFNFTSSVNPMPSQDDWSVLPDGSIAFVRSIDYRVEYLNADGSRSTTGKLPFDWQPMPREAKERLVDSVRNVQSKNARSQYTTALIRWVNTYKRKYPANFTAPEGYVPAQGFAKDWAFPPGTNFPPNYIYGCAEGEEPKMLSGPNGSSAAGGPPPGAGAEGKLVNPMAPMAGMPGMPGGQGGTPSCIPMPIPNLAQIPNPPTLREVLVISPEKLADFRPPFGSNAVRADMDGNLWIRTAQSRSTRAGAVYDVVSRTGLIDRIQVPTGYTIVGFGRGRVVFLSTRDPSGLHLARVRLR
jgi:hypothetical protein